MNLRRLSLLALVLACADSRARGFRARAPALDLAARDTTCSPCRDFFRYANGRGSTARRFRPRPGDGAGARCSSGIGGAAAGPERGRGPGRDREGSNRRQARHLYAVSWIPRAPIRKARGRSGPPRAHRRDPGRERSAARSRASPRRRERRRSASRRAPDPKNSRNDRGDLQGGLGLPDRDYYTEGRREARGTTARPVRRARREDVRAAGRRRASRGARARDASWRIETRARASVADARRAARPERRSTTG